MDKRLSDLDWSLVQSFLAVAETGSLSAAARALNASQPTLGRHIRALESALNVELFRRQSRGLVLTELGHQLLAPALQMRDAMQALSLTAAGGVEDVRGDVRIATSVFMAHHAMPEIVAAIRATEPDIHIDLVPSDSSENLLFREADIAVRMYRPEQLDMVTLHLGDIQLGMFATKGYLNQRGRPRAVGDMKLHDLVGYDANDDIIRGMRELGIPATRDWFSVRCDNQSAYWQLVRAGCGLGFGQANVGRSDPDLEEVLTEFPLPTLPVWLTAHEAVRRTPRVARVWDILRARLLPFIS